MRPEVKRWFKIVFCTLMVVFSVSIGFSDWVYPDNSGDKTSWKGQPTQSEKIACAYIDGNKFVLYTIEDALAKAAEKSNKGTTAVNVFVKPGTETTIGNCTIAKNVTLTLPYSNETYNEKNFMNFVKDANGNNTDNVTNDFADTNPTLYRKISVRIKSDACLTIANGARLNIGGQNGGTSPQGATTGLYAEVLLQNGASINCSGTIECFGFIKEESKGGASIVMENQGILYQPLCVYDWGGATSVYRKQRDGVFPFNRFDCPNVRPFITFKKGSTFNCFVHVWGSSAGHFYTNADIISENNNSFLVLTEANSSISWHFTDKSDLNATSTSDTNHLTEINTYSNVNLSKIKVTLNAPMVGEMNIDSSNYYLPVYYGYSIKANSGILSIKYRTKFLPGSKFYVANGATATFSQNAVFYQSNKGQDGNTIPSYGNSTPALLSNSGIVNVNAGFEGKIIAANSTSAKTIFSASYVPVFDCYEGVYQGSSLLVLSTPIVKYGCFSFGGARGLIAKDTSGSDKIPNAGFGSGVTYYASNDFWYHAPGSSFNFDFVFIDNITGQLSTDAGKSKEFTLAVSISPSALDVKTILWKVETQKEKSDCNVKDATFKDGINNEKQIVIVVPANTESKHGGFLGIGKEKHDCKYLVTVTVTDANNVSKSYQITLTAKVG